ncbi:hypothetical protein SAMN02745135_02182 [Caloranaerobacter azorensis DSM 13643]|uniref:Uncharacterized protein n=1 Tax=Caloranaerobacter azorensis DSM 13643 TaxID=1121264 RepID=A0A1M5VXF9_9FIRM|nr:hypothetical protein [Caloranaerobacter azorensis]SHH79888.1 hypothetical protein SAMN02745135_02182 [Caloranaerobacter azorensis DSM 13643]
MNKKFILFIPFITMLIFTGCDYENNNCYILNDNNYKKVEREQTIIEDVSGLEELEIINGVGNIEIKTTNSDKLRIKAKKIANATSDVIAKELLDVIDVKAFKVGNKISVKAVYTNNEKKDIWELKSEKYDCGDLEITYVIEMPSNIGKITLETDVGNVKLIDVKGMFNVKTGVGNIYGNNIIPVKNSNFNSGTGNAKIKFANLEESDIIDVNCGVGNIKLIIPKDAKCTIEKEEFMKDKTRQEINGGGVLIKVEVSTGDIEIEQE